MSLVALVLALAIFIFILKAWPEICCFYKRVKFSRSFNMPSFKELLENIRKEEALFWFEELRKRYGSRYCIWFGNKLSIFISDPEDVKFVLGSNKLLSKSDNYSIIEQWIKETILTTSGETWHKQRKMVTPAFHFKILDEFKQPMEDICSIMIEKLMEKANVGEAIDIYSYVTLLALDIICQTSMGTSSNAQLQNTSDSREYVNSVHTFTDDFKKQQHAMNVVRSNSGKVFEMRKETFKSSNIRTLADAEATDSYGVKRRLAFLDILLLAQVEEADITDEEIRVAVDAAMFAGHDTTSSAISFAIFALSQHKDVQQKAYEEAVEMKGKEREPMRYLEAVIKETLRVYPSVPLYSRKASEDVQMRDINIPKGTAVVILAYSVHRNEKYYPEPDRFYPERFLNDDNNNKNPYAFVAFSAGVRNCIGQKYAILELKVVLSMVLRAFEILPVEGFVPIQTADITLKSKNGLYVRLKKR